MKRYTGKCLEADVAELNKTLESLGADMRFDVGYRYNYTAIDLATPSQLARHCCHRNLETGTPRACLAACNAYVASETAKMLAKRAEINATAAARGGAS